MEYNVTFRKKDKNIQAVISYKDNNGKWRQKAKQGFKTQKDAKPFIKTTLKMLEMKLSNENNIVNSNYSDITFEQLKDEFIEHSKIYKESNTIRTYENACHNFKNLNSKKVCEIKKSDLSKCIDNMIINNLKKSTIKTYIGKLKLILNFYRENYDPSFSINTDFKISKDKKSNSKKALDKNELMTLLNNSQLKKSKFYIVAFIAANTGLRVGEILGLTWTDLNKDKMILTVDKQWKKLKNGKFGFGELKNQNSYRNIPITSKFIKELNNYKISTPTDINNRIAPFRHDGIGKCLNPLLHKLAGISIHELRHTYITLLIKNNIDFKTVAKIAGHDVEQTLKTYSHVTDDMIKEASNTIAKIF